MDILAIFMQTNTSKNSVKSGDQAALTSDATNTTTTPPTPSKAAAGTKAAKKGKEGDVSNKADQDTNGPCLPVQITPTDIFLAEESPQGEAVIGPLTVHEQQDLERCEAVIEKNKDAFKQTAAAMSEILAKRLYRTHYKSFREYCEQRWKFSRSYGYRLKQAHEELENVSPIGDTSEPIENEYQARKRRKAQKEKAEDPKVNSASKNCGDKPSREQAQEEGENSAASGDSSEIDTKPPEQEDAAQSKNAEVPEAAEPSNVTVLPTATTATGMVWVELPAQFLKVPKLPSLKELSKDARTLEMIRSNSLKKPEMEKLIGNLNRWLPLYAEWEQKYLVQAPAAEAKEAA
jgi:hypothetical protein